MIDQQMTLTRGQYNIGDTLLWSVGQVMIVNRTRADDPELEIFSVVKLPRFDPQTRDLAVLGAGRALQRLGARFRYAEQEADYEHVVSALRELGLVICPYGKGLVSDCITHKVEVNAGQLPQYLVEDSHPAIVDTNPALKEL